jgi:hypothetical protein
MALTNLLGTISSYFRIKDIELKNNSSILEIKNTSDTLIVARAADPVGDTDVATKGWINSNVSVPPNIVKSITLTATTSTATSTATVPTNAIVHDIRVKVGTVYDNASVATIKVAEQTIYASLAMQETELFQLVVRELITTGGVVSIEFSLSPTTGACTVEIYYSIPSV